MVTPLKLIQGTLLTAAPIKYYASPAGVATVIKKLTVINIDAVNAHTASIWLVPSGGAPGTPTLLIDAQPVPPKGTLDVTEAQNQVLQGGDMIYAEADDAINSQIQASGVQIV
jgi:hypothetical protein